MSQLARLKTALNPHNLHAIWGHGDSDPDLGASFGPLVIAKDGAIPLVRSELIAGEVRIEGKVSIAPHATIRRQTSIYGSAQHGSEIGEYALLMDYCRLEDSKLGRGAGFAHGGVSQFADWGDWSFGNIEPRVTGRADKRVTIEEGAYLGPGLWVPAGGHVRANLYYIGHPAFILPHTQLDAETFEPTGNRIKHGQVVATDAPLIHRPIALSDAELDLADKGELPREDLLHFWRLGARPLHQPPIGDVDITQLQQVGVDGWIDAQQRNVVHRPALANWLWYYPLVQHVKQVSYQHEDAKQFGNIVWHSAILQSDILYLDRAHRVLNAILAPELITHQLGQFIKAKLYLAGAYKPSGQKELEAISLAHEHAGEILASVSERIARHKDDIAVTIPRRATIDHALKQTGDRLHIRMGRDEHAALRSVLADIAAREASFALRAAQSGLPHVAANENAQEPDSWVHAINEHRVNFATLQDGPVVRSFAGLVPVIEDDVTLVGKVDIGGGVHLGAGATLVDGSVRSEQNGAPVFIGGSAYIENAITHTATKEKWPVFIDGDAGPIVVQGGHVHGVHILPNTYSKNALLSDEGRVNGVIAENALNAGQAQEGKDGKLAYIGGCFSVDVFERKQDGTLTYPAQFADYKAWWATSPFRDIPLSEAGVDDVQVKARIHAIYVEKQHAARAELDKKVERYGELYRHSAQLQAALLQVQHAAAILEAQHRPVLKQQLLQIGEGLEYALGIRQGISDGALAQLTRGHGALDIAAQELSDLAAQGKTISIYDWNDASPYAPTEQDVRAIADGAYRPVTRHAQRNFDIANKLSETKGVDHVITAAHVLKEGLRAHVEYHPGTLTTLAAQLRRIPGQIAALEQSVHARTAQPVVARGYAPQRVLAAK